MLIEIRADWEPKFRVEMTCLLPADNCKTVFKKSLQREGLLRDKERNPPLQVVGTRSGAIRPGTSLTNPQKSHESRSDELIAGWKALKQTLRVCLRARLK